MFKLRQFIKGLELLLGSMLLVIAIVFAEKKHCSRTCEDIEIVIKNKETQQFVTKEDLLKRLTVVSSIPILGTTLQALETRSIENIIHSNSFVRKGIAYKNWKGVLKIMISPRRPIARVLYPYDHSQYIDEDGTLLPLSDQYTARVMLVEIEKFCGVSKSLNEHPYGAALLALLKYLDQDSFWRAQIVHMCIDKKGKIVMNTQISKQCIEFGLPVSLEKKMAKLKLFYKKILPYKGWNAYKRVNLEFDNQIVCE